MLCYNVPCTEFEVALFAIRSINNVKHDLPVAEIWVRFLVILRHICLAVVFLSGSRIPFDAGKHAIWGVANFPLLAVSYHLLRVWMKSILIVFVVILLVFPFFFWLKWR